MSVYQNLVDARTRHANSAVVDLKLNDGSNTVIRIAELAGITVRESGGTDGSYAVGSAEPLEHIHNRYTCNVTAQRFIWRETAMTMFNIAQRGLLDLPTFDITCTDEIDGAVLFTIEGCTLADRSQAVQANQREMADMSFLALRTVPAETSGVTAVTAPGTTQRTFGTPVDQPTFLDDSPIMAFMNLFADPAPQA